MICRVTVNDGIGQNPPETKVLLSPALRSLPMQGKQINTAPVAHQDRAQDS